MKKSLGVLILGFLSLLLISCVTIRWEHAAKSSDAFDSELNLCRAVVYKKWFGFNQPTLAQAQDCNLVHDIKQCLRGRGWKEIDAGWSCPGT